MNQETTLEKPKQIPNRFVYYKNVDSKLAKLLTLAGKVLFRCNNVVPSKERVEKFARFLTSSDQLADKVANEVFSQLSSAKSRKLLNRALEEGIDAIDSPPQSLIDLFAQGESEPEWLDRDKLEYGAHICRRMGRYAMYVLGDLSLLGGYANPDISKPLIFTGALNGESTFNRLGETTSFWYDVTEPGALKKGQKGFKAAIRVRIMHALVRRRLLQHPDWQSQEWGWPINMADAVATNMAFSMIMIMGTKLLGFRFPQKDIEAVLHLWKYIGYLMGDDADWLPATVEEGMQAMYLITLANSNIPDQDSLDLARDYLESFKHKNMSLPMRFTGWFKYHFHKAYAKYLISKELHQALQLPDSKVLWLAIPIVQTPVIFVVDTLRMYIPGVGKIMEKIGRRGQYKIVLYRMGNKTAQYVPVKTLRR